MAKPDDLDTLFSWMEIEKMIAFIILSENDNKDYTLYSFHNKGKLRSLFSGRKKALEDYLQSKSIPQQSVAFYWLSDRQSLFCKCVKFFEGIGRVVYFNLSWTLSLLR